MCFSPHVEPFPFPCTLSVACGETEILPASKEVFNNERVNLIWTYLHSPCVYMNTFIARIWSPLTLLISDPSLHISLHQAITKESLVLAVEAMELDFDLWQRYFDDFLKHKLRLGGPRIEAISQQILRVFFGELHEQEAMSRLVILHCYSHAYRQDLAKMANLLRPLNQIQQVRNEKPK